MLFATPDLLKEIHDNFIATYTPIIYKQTIYIMVDYETYEPMSELIPDRTMWLPLRRFDLQKFCNNVYNLLFRSDMELINFEFRLLQAGEQYDGKVDSVLVRTPDGLRVLSDKGILEKPTGHFIPNCLPIMLNNDPDTKRRLFKVISDWTNSEANAHSLLHHIATALAPHWSAVKYLLIIGEGRNGKSVFLNMVTKVFGRENISSVSRQDMAKKSSTCVDLNGSLLNIIMDGSEGFISDAGPEKGLTAGDFVPIRMLYQSTNTIVQTNGLFVEALNNEPRTRDKSFALQRRLVRFKFPNTYDEDPLFSDQMLSDEMTGALLALLIEHYVRRDEVKEKLVVTEESKQLLLAHQLANDSILAWIASIEDDSEKDIGSVFIGTPFDIHIQAYSAWLQNKISGYEIDQLQIAKQLKEYFVIKRSSRRTPPTNYYKITSFASKTLNFLEEYRKLKEAESISEDSNDTN